MDVDLNDAGVRPLYLRYALVVMLLDSGRALTVAELVMGLERLGLSVPGRPSKTVSDALRWEVARGRVVRVRRGVYRVGVVAKATRHRMRARVAAMRNQAVRCCGPSELTAIEVTTAALGQLEQRPT